MLYAASTARHIAAFHLPLLDALRGGGWDITVACGDAHSLPHTFKRLDIPFDKHFLSPRNLAALRMLIREIKAGQYDMISTHTALAGCLTRMALALSGRAGRTVCVHTAHGYLFGRGTPLSGKVTYPFEYACRYVTDAVLTMNAEDTRYAARLVRRGGLVRRVSGMGVDTGVFRPASAPDKAAARKALGLPDGFLLFYAAEFSKRKNHRPLIEAMPAVVAACPDAYLVLAGDGRLTEAVKHMARGLGVGERVVFLGQVDSGAPYLRACDAAVSVSLSEGLPLGILEALACGVPVAASGVKGHTDLLGADYTWLFNPRDPGDVRGACVSLIGSVRSGAYAAPKFDIADYTKQAAVYNHLMLYEALSEGRRARLVTYS